MARESVSDRESDCISDCTSNCELARAIAGGSERALDELLEKYQADVRRMVGRLTAWSAEVDDLVQEVFIDAWRKANTFRGDGSLRGWLRQIALNRCRNHHRTTQRWWRTLKNFATQLSDHAEEQHVVEDPRWAQLQAALTKLSYNDRELLVIVYMEQQELSWLAGQWNVKEATLHVRLCRARKRLTTLIQQANESYEP